MKHDYPAAETAFSAAIGLDPSLALAHFSLGNALRSQGKLEAAVDEYKKAIELKPNDAESYSNLGNTLRILGKPDEAIAELQAAIRLNPKYCATHLNLGALLCDVKHDYVAAETAFRAAIQLQPNLRLRPLQSRERPGWPGKAGRGDRRIP